MALNSKRHIRYADDFLLLSRVIAAGNHLIAKINDFLQNNLKLSLHPNKVFIKTIASGADFLGWIHFPDYWILKTTTKRRMFKRIKNNPQNETIHSYLGLLKHGNTNKLKCKIVPLCGIWHSHDIDSLAMTDKV